MSENAVDRAVLFGSQFEVSPPDSIMWAYAERYPSVFMPFLVNSLDIHDPAAADTCIAELETGLWRGVGEVMLDCTNDGEMTVEWSDDRQQTIEKPVPEARENQPLFATVSDYCGRAGLPVLLHCRDPEVMQRTLGRFPTTTFIWAHVDHGYYNDIGTQLVAQHGDLICEFGAEFRFRRREAIEGTEDEHFVRQIDRWRRTCRSFPDRVIWGQDLFMWKDVEPGNYRGGIHAWEVLSQDSSEAEKRSIGGDNLRRIVGMAEPSVPGDA